MVLTFILLLSFMMLILLLGAIIMHRKRDWMVVHIYCPSEILFFDTEAERSKLCSQAITAFMRRPVTWILLLSYACVGSLLCDGLKEPTIILANEMPVNDEIKQFVWVLFMLIPLWCPSLIFCWHGRRWMRRYLRTYLNEHGVPICLNCGYDLRGLPESRCPECGTEFKKRG